MEKVYVCCCSCCCPFLFLYVYNIHKRTVSIKFCLNEEAQPNYLYNARNFKLQMWV